MNVRKVGDLFRPSSSAPLVEIHGGIHVVRDDLLPGGTKARFVGELFGLNDELVYATPQEGGAQTAISIVAHDIGKRATFFVANRKQKHQRVQLSELLGAKIVEIRPGYLSTVQARSDAYVGRERLRGKNIANLCFGLDSNIALEAIAHAASLLPRPKELWFSAGSGTLARGLALAWPDVPRFAVQVGHKLLPVDVAGAKIIEYWKPFSKAEEYTPPFPSDDHYDSKAFLVCLNERKGSGVTFWNVAAPAKVYLDVIKSFLDTEGVRAERTK